MQDLDHLKKIDILNSYRNITIILHVINQFDTDIFWKTCGNIYKNKQLNHDHFKNKRQGIRY